MTPTRTPTAAPRESYEKRVARAFPVPQCEPMNGRDIHAVVSTPLLDTLGKQLEVSLERVQETTRHAREIADRVLGSRPESETTGNSAPPPSGAVYVLMDQAASLHVALTVLAAEVERLHAI